MFCFILALPGLFLYVDSPIIVGFTSLRWPGPNPKSTRPNQKWFHKTRIYRSKFDLVQIFVPLNMDQVFGEAKAGTFVKSTGSFISHWLKQISSLLSYWWQKETNIWFTFLMVRQENSQRTFEVRKFTSQIPVLY